MSVLSVVHQAALHMHLSVDATRTMLNLFGKIHPELPTDPPTLLELPQQMVKKAVGTGKCVHSRLEGCMQRAMGTHVMELSNDIKI